MALSIPPTPGARARAARSLSADRRTGRKLLTAFVLASTSLMVLAGRASVTAACRDHERHRVEHRYQVGRRLDVVLAGSTDAVTVRGRSPVIAQDDDGTAVTAARKAVTDDVGTASTLTDDAPLQQQHMPWPSPLVQQECTVARGAVDRAGFPAATQTISSTLGVAGLFGLLANGAAASIVHSVTGPVRRVVRDLQASENGRRVHRLRPTSLHQLHTMSRAVDTTGDALLGAAREIGADARNLCMASEGPTATSGPPSPSAEETPTPAGIASTDAEQVPAVLTVPAGVHEIPPHMTEAGTAASTPAAGSVATTRYGAARSRAFGPTTALWHAVELDRMVGGIGGACETTVCGSLVRVGREQRWPLPARDVCPACSTLAH